ncbi:alpha carbonic anhydrase [Schizothecium vesticola]|uniref:Carbonic anhydrase n=1 Tax=Schizothecium vesticola TaxID=314040 RepID=A0AA40F0M8_9PEZI|nr:alpha carbonic anhydrase [Schizothecium vesticola]
MKSTLLLTFTLVRCVLSHELHGTSLHPRSEAVSPSFGYHGLKGPTNWYGINPETNTLCAKGTHQSPIDVSSTGCGPKSANPVFHVPAVPEGAEFLNLGTTVEVIANGTLIKGSKMFNLAQFHFHTPSEHSVDGKYYPMEVHFVFQAQDQSLSVVGFLIDLETPSSHHIDASLLGTIAKSLERIQHAGDSTNTGALAFDKLEQHFAAHGTFQYSGSLTTPPCSEGVSWVVSCTPIVVRAADYLAFRDVIKFNARFTQNTPGEINLIDNAAKELQR